MMNYQVLSETEPILEAPQAKMNVIVVMTTVRDISSGPHSARLGASPSDVISSMTVCLLLYALLYYRHFSARWTATRFRGGLSRVTHHSFIISEPWGSTARSRDECSFGLRYCWYGKGPVFCRLFGTEQVDWIHCLIEILSGERLPTHSSKVGETLSGGGPAQCTLLCKVSKKRELSEDWKGLVAWSVSFSTFIAVIASKHPDKSQELLAYHATILIEALRFGCKGWLSYDKLFRENIVKEPHSTAPDVLQPFISQSESWRAHLSKMYGTGQL